MSGQGPYDVDGHAFTGWESTNELSGDDREVVQILAEHRIPDPQVRAAVDERLKLIEGDLVPTCECGWRGHAEEWERPSARDQTSSQHISHKHHAQMTRVQGEHGARVAASALEHVAAEWSGDAGFAQWLRAQANHLRDAKLYDGEHWPES